jgi:hypothetical protein
MKTPAAAAFAPTYALNVQTLYTQCLPFLPESIQALCRQIVCARQFRRLHFSSKLARNLYAPCNSLLKSLPHESI